MLKHLSGVIGQPEEADVTAAAEIIAEGGGTAGSQNSFDWVGFTDALGNTFSVGIDAYGQFLIAQATAESMSQTPTGLLPPIGGSIAVEPSGVITESDTQMFLTLGLIGLGLIFLGRKL